MQRLPPTVGKGKFSTEILDELTIMLSLTLFQMVLSNNAMLIPNVQVYHQAEK